MTDTEEKLPVKKNGFHPKGCVQVFSIPMCWDIQVSDDDIERGFIDVDFNGKDIRVLLAKS